jgi:hypothetical protein
MIREYKYTTTREVQQKAAHSHEASSFLTKMYALCQLIPSSLCWGICIEKCSKILNTVLILGKCESAYAQLSVYN